MWPTSPAATSAVPAQQTGLPCYTSSKPGATPDRWASNTLPARIPLAVELAFQIQDELKQRYEALDRIRRQYLERLEYEATMAKR